MMLYDWAAPTAPRVGDGAWFRSKDGSAEAWYCIAYAPASDWECAAEILRIGLAMLSMF